ncbi:hypothetical protein [Candidatus Uabimicrobium sp. HlEnr_7]|uniref:hypothetical protein n=1 Tax=Candidatus Uabimicrobium helgolandensis TaxID=3095367 RepID=UPI003556C26C
MPSKNIANISALKLKEMNETWQKIAKNDNNPFGGFNLSGSHRELSKEYSLNEINYIIKNELSSCLSSFAYGGNNSSQWIFLVGEKGAGKTQLLNWLKEETNKNQALYLRTKPFPGCKAVDYYLMRQIFDSLLLFSFPQESVPALNTICINILRSTVLELLKDENLPIERICSNTKVTKRELRNKTMSDNDFPYLLDSLYLDVLITAAVKKSDLKTDECHWFEKLLRAGLNDKNKEFLTEVFSPNNDLVAIKKALLYLISQGEKTICIGLDKFEETFTIFHKIYPTNKIQNLIKELFVDISELIESSNNLMFIFTCRQDHWTGKHGVVNIVPKKIISEIRHQFTLHKPAFKELLILINSTLNRFWMRNHFTPPRHEELIFPFLQREVYGIWEYSSSIGYIFSYLEQLFEKSKKRILDGETVEELIHRAQKVTDTDRKQQVKMRQTMRVGQQKIIRQQSNLKKMHSKLQQLQKEISQATTEDAFLKTIYAKLENALNEFEKNAQIWIDESIEVYGQFQEKNNALAKREEEVNQREQKILLQNKLLQERENDFKKQEKILSVHGIKIATAKNKKHQRVTKRFDSIIKNKVIHSEDICQLMIKCGYIIGKDKTIQDVNQLIMLIDHEEIFTLLESICTMSQLRQLCQQSDLSSRGTAKDLILRLLKEG